MNPVLLVIGAVLVGGAALVHVFIFTLESISWQRPATWRRFGLRSQEDADTVRPMAFNQGFYNLFLAIGAAAGIVMLFVPATQQAGFATAVFAAGSMVSAAAVLLISSPALARAALTQGLAPLLGVLALVLAALL
jgi:putative membrane protein